MRVLSIIFLALLPFFATAQVFGSIPFRGECSFLFRGQIIDPEAMAILNELNLESLEKCEHASWGVDYMAASEVREQKGVSYFELRRVFNHDGVWEMYPPLELEHRELVETYMLNQPQAEVLYDDEGFVRVEGVSLGQFRQLSDLWSRILSSKREFSRSISELSVLESIVYDMTEFEKLLSEPNDPLQLKEVVFRRGGAFGGGDALEFPHFAVVVSNSSENWSFDIDFDESGITFRTPPIKFAD